jgi:hypothetical protein
MTSQIAIMNYDGVAIASDTITSLKSSRGTKTIGNASKIWDIGPKHSVVVLHSGSTVINSISHRMHFTEWAKSLEAPLPTLKQYVDSYYAFCSHAHHLISFDDEKKFAENCIQSMLANIKDYIDQALPHWNAERETWTSVGEDEFEIARNRYTEFIAMYEKVGEFPKFNDDQARKLITNYNFDLDSIMTKSFAKQSRKHVSWRYLEEILRFASLPNLLLWDTVQTNHTPATSDVTIEESMEVICSAPKRITKL